MLSCPIIQRNGRDYILHVRYNGYPPHVIEELTNSIVKDERRHKFITRKWGRVFRLVGQKVFEVIILTLYEHFFLIFIFIIINNKKNYYFRVIKADVLLLNFYKKFKNSYQRDKRLEILHLICTHMHVSFYQVK